MKCADAESVPEEVAANVDHVETYSLGSNSDPSTFLCCVYTLLSMRATPELFLAMVNNRDSTFVRAAGFLAIRYSFKGQDVWDTLKEYLFDTEPFCPRRHSSASVLQPGVEPTANTSMGEWVEGLVSEDKYHGTVLPRLPLPVKREVGMYMMALPDLRKRYYFNAQHLELFRHAGQAVQVFRCGAWEEGQLLMLKASKSHRIRCVVRSLSGAKEEVSLGAVQRRHRDVDAGDSDRRARSRSRSQSAGSPRSSRSPTSSRRAQKEALPQQHQVDLLREEFMRREREHATVEPGEKCYKHVMCHRPSLFGKEPGFANCKPREPREKTARSCAQPKTGHGHGGGESDESPEDDEREAAARVAAERSAERSKQMQEVWQKYGVQAERVGSQARQAYIGGGATGAAVGAKDLIDTPDTLWLG